MKVTLVKGSHDSKSKTPFYDTLIIEAEQTLEELMIQEVMIDIEALAKELEGGHANA